MRPKVTNLMTVLVALLVTAAGWAQTVPPPSDTSSANEATPFRPLEGLIIINLPSVSTPSAGTLTFLITHRFLIPVQESNIYDLFSLGDHADVGLGLSYASLRNLDVSFYRSSELGVWEVAAKYHFFSHGLFAASLRTGGDWRTEPGIQHRSSFFAQGILALSLGSRVRITAVPTYLSTDLCQAF